jgi:hypothetical protein
MLFTDGLWRHSAASKAEAEAEDAATSIHLDVGTSVSFVHDALQLVAAVIKLGLAKTALATSPPPAPAEKADG